MLSVYGKISLFLSCFDFDSIIISLERERKKPRGCRKKFVKWLCDYVTLPTLGPGQTGSQEKAESARGPHESPGHLWLARIIKVKAEWVPSPSTQPLFRIQHPTSTPPFHCTLPSKRRLASRKFDLVSVPTPDLVLPCASGSAPRHFVIYPRGLRNPQLSTRNHGRLR